MNTDVVRELHYCGEDACLGVDLENGPSSARSSLRRGAPEGAIAIANQSSIRVTSFRGDLVSGEFHNRGAQSAGCINLEYSANKGTTVPCRPPKETGTIAD